MEKNIKFSLVLFLQLTITSPAMPVHNWRLPPLVHWPQAFDAVEGKQLAPPCDGRISTTAALAQAPPATAISPHLWLRFPLLESGRSVRIHTLQLGKKLSWALVLYSNSEKIANKTTIFKNWDPEIIWDLWEDIVLEQKWSKTVKWYITFNFQPLLSLETGILLIHMLNPRTWGTRRRCDSLAEWVEVPK
jgi:hypothetical protein